MSTTRSQWNGRPRYSVVTDSGITCTTADAGLATRRAAAMRANGWHAIVVTATTRQARDKAAREWWAKCRAERDAAPR